MELSKRGVERETSRRMRRWAVDAGDQIRLMRLDAGVTQAELAAVVGVDRSYVPRIEAGDARPSLEVLTAIGLALGAELSLRYFPGSGPRLHDRVQAVMIERLLRELYEGWRVSPEVPVGQPRRGVIDLVTEDRSRSLLVAIEVQSQIRRLEQQIRWANEKAEALRAASTDARLVSRVLVLRSTMATREIAREFEATLATAYPARTADVVQALVSRTASWPGPGVVWMDVRGAQASLLRHPPRGVMLGR